MSKTLSLSGVTKTFELDSNFEVLKNITLEVNEGEFVSIVGPSGCGKSILLYLIAGFFKKTSGEILIDGKPVGEPGTDRMMVFQDYVLLPWKTVKENILFALEKSGLKTEEKNKLVDYYLDLTGLSPFKDWFAHKLSGGMKQRVAIARALIVSSKILLMDEPFSALDSQRRKQMRESLLEISQKTNITVLFVTHSVSEALYLSDRIYVMTRRPSSIKNEYIVDMPMPRNPMSEEYIQLKDRISKDLAEEFNNDSIQTPYEK